jgi:hypothetical protein
VYGCWAAIGPGKLLLQLIVFHFCCHCLSSPVMRA